MSMTSKRQIVHAAVFAAALLTGAQGMSRGHFASSPGGASGEAPGVDHHMHIFSPAASAVLARICDKLGPKGCPAEVSHAPATGDDAIQALDKAGIARGVLLSGGYLFESPELADDPAEAARGARQENAFTVAQARTHCGRLAPFISVAPLSPAAVNEVRYWGKAGGAVGLKLHLGSSRFDFRDPAQVKALAAVFRAAGEAHLAIVIHMQTRNPDYGAEDAKIFLRDVVPFARGVTIQVAHAAGGGGIDKGELAALGVFAEAIQNNPATTRNLYFDLAMVPDLFANAGKIPASPANVAALEGLMRRIGLDRFLLASDYTPGLDLKAYFANEKSALALSDADWRRLAANAAPYMAKIRQDRCTRINAGTRR